MSTTTNKQALRNSADRDWFEEWFKKKYHPNKTGPYIKDQMFFAIQAARAPLLDELDAAQKSNEFLKEQLAQLASFNPDWDKLEAATDSIREHMVELIAARNRIAELEAREVKLPKKNIGWDGDRDYCRNNAIEECSKAIRAAGITVKGE